MGNEKALDEIEKVTEPPKKKESIWRCPICCTVIKHRQNVQRHQAVCPSANEKKVTKTKVEKIQLIFNCDYCHAAFSLQKSLKAHIKRNHLEEYCLQNESTLFKCSKCDFKTTGEKYLKTHFSKFHMQKGNFVCNICDKRYATNGSLRVHKKTHLSVKKSYVCEYCGCVIVTSSEHDVHNCRQGVGDISGAHSLYDTIELSNGECKLTNNNTEVPRKNITQPNNLGFPNNTELSNREYVNNNQQFSNTNNQFIQEDSKPLGVIRSMEDYQFHTQHMDW